MSSSPFVPEEEENLIRRFLCCLKELHDNDNDVNKNGAVPRDIYEVIRPNPQGDVNGQVQWLVNNLLEQRHIERVDNDKVKITHDGRVQCNEKPLDKYGHAYCAGLGDCSDEYKRRRKEKQKQTK
jgi:hypothetical protein